MFLPGQKVQLASTVGPLAGLVGTVIQSSSAAFATQKSPISIQVKIVTDSNQSFTVWVPQDQLALVT